MSELKFFSLNYMWGEVREGVASLWGFIGLNDLHSAIFWMNLLSLLRRLSFSVRSIQLKIEPRYFFQPRETFFSIRLLRCPSGLWDDGKPHIWKGETTQSNSFFLCFFPLFFLLLIMHMVAIKTPKMKWNERRRTFRLGSSSSSNNNKWTHEEE